MCIAKRSTSRKSYYLYAMFKFINVYVLLKFLLKYYFICICICMPCDSNVSYEVTYYVIAGSKYGYGASTISRYVTSSGVFKRTESHEKVYNVPKYHIRYITFCIIKKIIPWMNEWPFIPIHICEPAGSYLFYNVY